MKRRDPRSSARFFKLAGVRTRLHTFILSVSIAVFAGRATLWSSTEVEATAFEERSDEPGLLVASVNMAMERDVDTIVDELRSLPVLRECDVLFAQEVVRRDGGISVAEEVAQRLGYHVAFASPEGHSTVGGLAILSRFPLSEIKVRKLKPQNLVFRSRKRIALGATVETPLGPVRVINTHLDTRINPGKRVDQLGPAIEDAKAFPGAAVIGGDLNTNDMQWVSNIVPVPFPGWQASRVRILMRTHGFSTPFMTRKATFDHMGMQLDWIFTHRLTAVASGIQPLEFSDHHAIWTRLGAESRETMVSVAAGR